jgi:putative colanic acid biosynthesis UDP-glucose lipid carrier transferase
MSGQLDRNPATLHIVLRIGDVVLMWLAGAITYSIVFHLQLTRAPSIYNAMLYLYSMLAYFILPGIGVYENWYQRRFLASFALLACSLALILSMSLTAASTILSTSEVSRLWLISWFALSLMLLLGLRFVVFELLRLLKKKGLYCRQVVIVGYGQTGKELHQRVLENVWLGYNVQAIYIDRSLTSEIPLLPHVRLLSDLEILAEYVAKNGVAEVWLTLPFGDSEQLYKLRHLLQDALVDVRLIPDVDNVELLSRKMVDFFGFPTIDLNRPQIAGAYAIGKDLFDRVFAAFALLVTAPLLVTIAVVVKLTSPGPVIFRQRRLGLNGKSFYLYKFRSMRYEPLENVSQATTNDSRVTPVGRVLRRTSLDELPQFFNVLVGDMSVVGPRPHALQHNEIYRKKLERYMLRHRVKPGITGWAQINGFRGETDTDDKMAMRVQHDIHYIKNWSFWLDLKIIFLTGLKGWYGSNAY